MIDTARLFSILNTQLFVFWEDDFGFNPSKEAILYSFARIPSSDREYLLDDITDCKPSLHKGLSDFSGMVDDWYPLIEDWARDITYDDFADVIAYLKTVRYGQYSELLSIYYNINSNDLEEISVALTKYGIGLRIPPAYNMFFQDYIHKQSSWLSVRVYTDFNQEVRMSSLNDLSLAFKNSEDTAVICIIDNLLNRDYRADEILNLLQTCNKDSRHKIIGAVYSTKEKPPSIVVDNLFIEAVKKECPADLASALVKSSFSFFISEYRDNTLKDIRTTFGKLLQERNLTPYLSGMALSEGVSDYSILSEWLNLMFNYQVSRNKSLPNLIKMSKIMGMMINDEVNVYSDDFIDELLKLNTYEAFDLHTNRFFQPTTPGDIFIDSKNHYYILIGQECDYMMGEKRKRRNASCEMLKAESIAMDDNSKIDSNLQYVCINNFIDHNGTKCALRIDYTSRIIIDNEILNLSIFNEHGECEINIKSPLDINKQLIMQDYLIKYHSDLQRYFNTVVEYRSRDCEEFDVLFTSLFTTPKLINITQYHEQGDQICFDLKRTGHIKPPYIHYLHKLYLEYRGRQPYTSVNMSRYEDLKVDFVFGEIKLSANVLVQLSSQRQKNQKDFHKLPWSIETRLLKDFLKAHSIECDFGEQKYMQIKSEHKILLSETMMLVLQQVKGPQLTIEIQAVEMHDLTEAKK